MGNGLALFKYRFLLWQLVKRDYKIRYKRSALGVLWSLLNPFLTMLVLAAVFSHFFRFEIENYPVYLISGQLVFNFFSESTTSAMTSISAGGSLIRKVYTPGIVFPVARVISSLVNLLFSLLALFLTMLFTGAPVHATLLLLPAAIFYVFVFSLGAGLLLSAMTVFFRDMTHLYGLFLSALVYATPVFYPASIIPEAYLPLLRLNPMVHFVSYFRSVALYGQIPSLRQNAACALCCLAMLLVGWWYFCKQQGRFMLYV